MSALPLLAAVAALYAWGVHRARRPWPWWRAAAMGAALVVLAFALGDPVDAASDRRLSMHMVEHLLIGTVAPVLVAVAAPVRLALGSLPRGSRRALAHALNGRAVRVLSRPIVAFPLATAVLFAYHLSPPIFDAAFEVPLVHPLEHAAMFWTALPCAMLLVGADPLPHRPSGVGVVGWMSLPMIAMAGIGAAYTSWTTVHFAHYAALPGALADQHAAGTVMWAGAAVLVPLTVLLAWLALWREEQRQRRRDAALEVAA
jgi:cytochrome c oxidase assembly factor CtaG